MMRFYVKKRRIPSITIISLIDILVILLIFFIVTTTFSKKEGALKIHLPSSSTAQNRTKEETSTLILEIKSQDEIFLEGKKLNFTQLEEELKNQVKKENRLEIHADESLPLGVMIHLLDEAHKAGIENISTITKKEIHSS